MDFPHLVVTWSPSLRQLPPHSGGHSATEVGVGAERFDALLLAEVVGATAVGAVAARANAIAREAGRLLIDVPHGAVRLAASTTVSGHEQNAGDGSFVLDSKLIGHSDGRLMCPSNVTHRLSFTNHQLCDLRVEWDAQPSTTLLDYANGSGWEAAWQGHLVVYGGSRPRRKRSDERTSTLRVAARPAGATAPEPAEIPVSLTLNVLDDKGSLTGATNHDWQVLHQLELT